MKTLLLVGNSRDQFFSYYDNTSELGIFNIYNIDNPINRIVRKFFSLFDLCPSFIFGKWKEELNDCSLVIFSDDIVDSSVIRYVSKKGIKTVFWYRNSLQAKDYQKAARRHILHEKKCNMVISYDKYDCEKRGFKYIENCYYAKEINNLRQTYDVVFLGKTKSRYANIMSVVNYLDNIGLKNWWYLVDSRKSDNQIVHKQYFDYVEYIKIVAQGKCILDVVDSGYQNGYTLRVFESLFYKKKLLTNMRMIKNEPFYHPNNIYVFDENDPKSLEGFIDFLGCDYTEIDYSLFEKHDLLNWIEEIRHLVGLN